MSDGLPEQICVTNNHHTAALLFVLVLFIIQYVRLKLRVVISRSTTWQAVGPESKKSSTFINHHNQREIRWSTFNQHQCLVLKVWSLKKCPFDFPSGHYIFWAIIPEILWSANHESAIHISLSKCFPKNFQNFLELCKILIKVFISSLSFFLCLLKHTQ